MGALRDKSFIFSNKFLNASFFKRKDCNLSYFSPLSFDLKLNDSDEIIIDWEVNPGKKFWKYRLERSTDLHVFTGLFPFKVCDRKVSHKDNQPLDGLSYYRIKRQDFYGNLEVSEFRILSIPSLSVCRNPVDGQILSLNNLKLKRNPTALEIIIYDESGIVKSSNTINYNDCSSYLHLYGNFSVGAYIMKVFTGGILLFTKNFRVSASLC